jgi:hypothetical protein
MRNYNRDNSIQLGKLLGRYGEFLDDMLMEPTSEFVQSLRDWIIDYHEEHHYQSFEDWYDKLIDVREATDEERELHGKWIKL